jgi:tetratricopeptide (TPR) repeat protein
MIFLFAALALAAQAAPSACPTVLTHEAQACRAIESSKAGRFAEAAAAFEQAAELSQQGDPARDRALAAAGNMWIAAGQPGKAAVALDKALAGGGLKADQHGLALLDRARAAESQGDLKTARAKINEAAKTISEDPYLWYFSAAVSLREDDIPAAKSSINRALAMVPDSAEVLFEAGHIAQASGENAQARDYWNRAIKADPDGPTGKAAREALAMTDAPLTVTNQVATRPDGDGEGGRTPEKN